VQLFIRQSEWPTQRLGYRPDNRGTFVRFLAQTRNDLFATRAHRLLHKARALGLFLSGMKRTGRETYRLSWYVRSHSVDMGNLILPCNGKR
jgi:hypothetical protein